MAKIKWKVQYRVKRGAKWKNTPFNCLTRRAAREIGQTLRNGSIDHFYTDSIYGPYGFGNTRVVAVRGKK